MRTMHQVSTIATIGVIVAVATAAEAADSYKIDKAHSAVLFRVKHLDFAYVYGRFRNIDGAFKVDERNPAKSSVKISIDASSVYTADKKRDKHLRAADFLNVKRYPKITFTSTKISRSGKRWKITGKLTLHGVTREVTASMMLIGSGKDPWGNQRIGFDGTLDFKRSKFGMTTMIGPAGDDIRLMLAFEGIKQ